MRVTFDRGVVAKVFQPLCMYGGREGTSDFKLQTPNFTLILSIAAKPFC